MQEAMQVIFFQANGDCNLPDVAELCAEDKTKRDAVLVVINESSFLS